MRRVRRLAATGETCRLEHEGEPSLLASVAPLCRFPPIAGALQETMRVKRTHTHVHKHTRASLPYYVRRTCRVRRDGATLLRPTRTCVYYWAEHLAVRATHSRLPRVERASERRAEPRWAESGRARIAVASPSVDVLYLDVRWNETRLRTHRGLLILALDRDWSRCYITSLIYMFFL